MGDARNWAVSQPVHHMTSRFCFHLFLGHTYLMARSHYFECEAHWAALLHGASGAASLMGLGIDSWPPLYPVTVISNLYNLTLGSPSSSSAHIHKEKWEICTTMVLPIFKFCKADAVISKPRVPHR
jgi:hypothetical protein